MYFFGDPLVKHAIEYYQSIDINDPESGDKFFGIFGPGNVVYHPPNKPFERFSDYEELLNIIQKDDPSKYNKIHKGKPFYFLSWLAFDLHNFEKALFYMDAAISEDIRKTPNNWINQPAGSFLILNMQNQAAHRICTKIRNLLELQIDRFNNISKNNVLSVQSFIDKFVKIFIQKFENRTIISSFYIYLLEFLDRYQELLLRSTEGGSIQPFIIYLFKGALIFESLLKYLYPKKDNGNPIKTLGDVFHNSTAFKNDFNINVTTSSTSLKDIFNKIEGNTLESAFNTTAKLRNTTGHNLVWDDVFSQPESFEKLFIQEMNAILYIILYKFA